MTLLEKSLIFIEKYGKPEPTKRTTSLDENTIRIMWDTLVVEYNEVDKSLVTDHFLKLHYKKQYLFTYWWYVIRHKRILMDNFVCSDDSNHRQGYLVVHHKTYDFRGCEVDYMETLETLCNYCHDERHSRKTKRPEKIISVGLYNLESKLRSHVLNIWDALIIDANNLLETLQKLQNK